MADSWPSAEGEGGEGGVVALSCERAGEEPFGEGEGAGVVDLDGSRDTISKGFVFTWDDGSIVEERGKGEAGERVRKGKGREGEEEGRGKRASAAL